MTSTQKTTPKTTTSNTKIDRDDPKRGAKLLALKIANDHPMAWRIKLETHGIPEFSIARSRRSYAFGTPSGKFSLPAMRKAAARAAACEGLPETCPVDCDAHETRALWHMAGDLLEEIERGRFAPEILAGDDAHAIRRGQEWLAVEAACAFARRPAKNKGEVFFKTWHRRDWEGETRLRLAADVAALHDEMIEADFARLHIVRAEFERLAAGVFARIDRLPRGI